MKIDGSYTLALPPDRAYDLLLDAEMLAKCIPGCKELERTGDDEYRMKMNMALAAISGQFDGRVRIADREPPRQFRLLVEGTGRIGFMKGDGLLRMLAGEVGTEVQYEGDVQVGGTIAAVGQRLMETTSRMMIKRFFDCLSKSVSSAEAGTSE